MKHTSITGALRRAAALSLALLLTLPTAFANAGLPRLHTSTELTEGLTFHNTITENYDRRVESFALELSPESPVQPIFVQGSGSVYGAADINKAVRNAQAQGYHVLGAVNTDFFSASTGVPLGVAIEDGVYKSTGYQGSAVVIGRDGSISLVDEPQVTLTLTNSRSGRVVSPHHLNKARSSTGGLYLLNRDFSSDTHTSSMGWHVKFRLVGGPAPLGVNSTLTLEVLQVVHTDQPLSIGADEYVLTSDDASGYSEVFRSFQEGDRVTLTTTCTDPVLSGARWATGAGDVMIRNGKLTDSSRWAYIQSGKAPRSALGVKADGTLLVYAVDGRQADYSDGLGQLDLAQELLEQGCLWAVNLDGGGSTAMSVWLPGQTGPQLLSRPSGGSPRGCATYLLLVAPQSGDGVPHRLALPRSDLVVLTGSSVTLPAPVALDNGLNVLSADPGPVEITSETGLGSVENSVFTAGSVPGVETLHLISPGLGVSGEIQLYVVDHLTDLSLTVDGKPVKSLSGRAGDQLSLSVTGSYWDRPALHEPSSVGWSLTGGAGTVDSSGRLTVRQRGSGTLTASAGGQTLSVPFSFLNSHTDVPSGHWAYDAVEFCYQQGISAGISPTLYGPDLSITRADFVVMIHNALGKPEATQSPAFKDVFPSDYYYPAIAWAKSAGVAAGVGDGLFRPRDLILREQAFSILYHTLSVMGSPLPDADLSVLDRFPDRDEISGWALEASAALVAQGLVSGGSRGLVPLDNLSRAEMAALMQKLMTFAPPVTPPKPEPEPQIRTGTVFDADDGLRIRSGPGTGYEVLGALHTGDRVEILESLDGWYHILYRSQNVRTIEGYVSADYVRLDP